MPLANGFPKIRHSAMCSYGLYASRFDNGYQNALKLWFDQSNRKADWFIGGYVQEIDLRVAAAVEPPNMISCIHVALLMI